MGAPHHLGGGRRCSRCSRAMWIYFASGLPSSQTLLAYQPPLPTNVRGYDGTPVQTFARERRVELSYDEYPPLVVHAFISAEDKDFFSHHGIDFTGPDRRGRPTIPIKSVIGGGRAKGGSTITQQVAKYLLKDSSYNVGRKAREAILAFRLESTLTKQQILELYLNSIFLGRNAYGVQAAARAYFDKDVNELTLARGGLSRGASQGAGQLRSGPRDAEGARPPQLCAARDVAQRLHHRGPVEGGGGDAARHHPLRQQREVPPAGRLFHGRGPPRADQAGSARTPRTGRTASMPAACGCAARWTR